MITIIKRHRLFIRSGQHHLRSPAHPQRSSVTIQSLGADAFALGQDKAIEIGEDGRIEPDTIFHQQNHLNAGLANIVFHVHFVFDEFDDR